LESLFGCATRVRERWEQDDMTGEVRFYDYKPFPDMDWVEFSAYFVRGSLKHLEQIAPTPSRQEPTP
jgi:hypothetical protein